MCGTLPAKSTCPAAGAANSPRRMEAFILCLEENGITVMPTAHPLPHMQKQCLYLKFVIWAGAHTAHNKVNLPEGQREDPLGEEVYLCLKV